MNKEREVLIIEDDRLVATSLANLLQQAKMRTTIAWNGDLALKLSQRKDFDLIISDIRMPGELGTDVVKKINQNHVRPIPFIFITGYSDEAYIQEAEKMGCRDFFHKPFDNEVLIRSLERVFSDPFQLNEPFRTAEKPIVPGYDPPSRFKRFFYNALGSQWNPEKEIDWHGPMGIDTSLCQAMAQILSPIIMGEYSAFNGIPRRILSFSNYEVKQYLAAQLVDETRHAEAFDLYLKRINATETYKKAWRNIRVVRYFNEMKKLADDEQWITGLLVTEITAHILLTNYIHATPCRMTGHLFSMILSDEARHISFVTYYLKEILKGASANDRQYLADIARHVLDLTGQMLDFYRAPLEAFHLDSIALFDQIRGEVENRVARNVLGVLEWTRV